MASTREPSWANPLALIFLELDTEPKVAKFFITNRLEWLLVVATAGLATLLTAFGRGHEPQIGDTLDITVTVIPADQRRLACAWEERIAGLSCAYAQPTAKSPSRKLEEKKRLAPYVSVDGQLVILAGVFASEEVASAAKLHKRSRDKRFRVRCSVKLIAQRANIPIRFSHRDAFKPADLTWVGRAENCLPQQ